MCVEEDLHAMSLISMGTDGISRWLLLIVAPAMGCAQDSAREGDDLLFDGKCVEGVPLRIQEFVL